MRADAKRRGTFASFNLSHKWPTHTSIPDFIWRVILAIAIHILSPVLIVLQCGKRADCIFAGVEEIDHRLAVAIALQS